MVLPREEFQRTLNLRAMPTEAEMKAEIERLRAENESLKRPRGQMSLRVSKGTAPGSRFW